MFRTLKLGRSCIAMANRTAPGSLSIHGADPQNLIEQIIRNRIHLSPFWNEECFGLTGIDNRPIVQSNS